MLNNFHYRAKDLAEAGRLALQAGIDVELPSIECYGEGIKKAIESGELSMETLDTAVRRHLQKKFELGLFENPYVDESRVYEVFETNAQRELAREIARKSMVLLKNDGLLPLRKDIRSLAVIGPNADEPRNLCGDYSYAATVELLRLQAPEPSDFTRADLDKLQKYSPEVVSILEAIRKSVSPATQVSYAKGCDTLGANTAGIATALKAAEQADTVILVLGDKSGLVPDCTTGETRDSARLTLPGLQDELARAVLETGKPVAVVLVTGRPYALRWMDEKANAILEAWLPGEEGGTAAAEILFGDANPGGKLPVTFPRHVGQVPIFYNHKPSGMKSHWYGDYVSEKAAPLYPFGHGLSYTSFEYSDLRIEKTKATLGETVEISFKVTNCGRRSGDEVVQLYTRDEYGSVPRPVKELKGYRRITLEPGQGRLVTFRLPINLLAFHNLENRLVLEAGRIFLMAGSSSEDIRLNGELEISGPEQMEVKERLFSCPVQVA
jgi:beta-glucosidase